MGLAKFMNESDVSELGLIQPRGCSGTREVVPACILCGVFFCADLPLSATVYLNKGQIPGKMPTKVCRMSWKSINVLKESIGQKHIGKEALEVSGGAQSATDGPRCTRLLKQASSDASSCCQEMCLFRSPWLARTVHFSRAETVYLSLNLCILYTNKKLKIKKRG